MSQKPIYNALAALAYIMLLITGLFWAPHFFHAAQEDTVFAPIIMLSLLVLSVALMAYLFFYQPLLLLLDGKKEEGIKFFLRTVGAFAVGTVTIIVVALISSR